MSQDVPKRKRDRKERKREKMRVKGEQERKGRRDRNERTCPKHVLKMLLAEILETIGLLAEMLRI